MLSRASHPLLNEGLQSVYYQRMLRGPRRWINPGL